MVTYALKSVCYYYAILFEIHIFVYILTYFLVKPNPGMSRYSYRQACYKFKLILFVNMLIITYILLYYYYILLNFNMKVILCLCVY
jgi:hypothetical protein